MKSLIVFVLIALCVQGNIERSSTVQEIFEGMKSEEFQQASFEYIINHLKSLDLNNLDLELDGGFFQDLFAFVHGFLDSLGMSTEITSEVKCNQNFHKFISNLDTILGEVIAGDFSKLIIQVPILIKQYNNMVEYCNETIIEYSRFFQNIGYNWKNAVDTGYGWKRLLTHTGQIKTDINNGVTAWKNKDYYSSGSNFGNILAIFLYGKQPSDFASVTAQSDSPSNAHFSAFFQEIIAQSLDENTVNSILGFASSIMGPAINNYAEETAAPTVSQNILENPQAQDLVTLVLNYASSIVAPALNHYDTDDLQ